MGRKQRGDSPQQRKMWLELRKRYRDNQKRKKEIQKQFDNGTYEHPDYLTLNGMSESDVKRLVGKESWQEKMDRESEEMFAREAKMCNYWSKSRKKYCRLSKNHSGEHSYF